MNRFGFIVLFVIVIAIAATSSWLLKKVDTSQTKAKEPIPHNMDYFLKNFNATVMNQQGKPHYNLIGDYLEHFPDDDSIDIDKPKLKMYRENLAPWHVKSNTARVLNRGKLIHLNGSVKMRRPESSSEPAIQLDTTNLKINLETDYAQTKEAVFIQTGKHRLKAVGMRVYLADGQLELLSRVKGVYYVPKK